MSMICPNCRKSIEGDRIAFCPYCGMKLPEPAAVPPAPEDEAADRWIRKALAETSYPKRKQILLQGLEENPDSREIAWELLFIGEEGTKRAKAYDYSIIKCWALDLYLRPEELKREKQDEMRAQLFDSPELNRCLNLFENPEEKHREYLLRLCRKFIVLFMEGDNRLMGSWFGFRIDRKKEKVLAEPAARMITRMKADEHLLPEQRQTLSNAMYRAFSERYAGKTEYLDEYLKE